MFEVKNLTVSYPDETCAPFDFSCVFPDGSLNNLKMKSGGGKTAVLKLMSGLFDVKNAKISGSILYNGEEVLSTGFNKKKLYRDVLFIPSFPEDAFFCADLQGEFDSFGIGREESKSAVERFGFSHEILRRDPLTLSGGQKRLISICIALTKKPRVLLLDNGFSGLDDYFKSVCVSNLEMFKKTENSVIVVSSLD